MTDSSATSLAAYHYNVSMQAQRVDILVAQRWSSDRASEFAGRAGELSKEVEREAQRQHDSARAEAAQFRREEFLREERRRAKRQGGMLLTFRPPPKEGPEMLLPPETGVLSSWRHQQPGSHISCTAACAITNIHRMKKRAAAAPRTTAA